MTKEVLGPVETATNAAKEVAAEPSKAVQEVAKTTSKALDLIRDAGKVFGPAAQELAETLSHRMAYYKFLNANNIAQKVEQLRAEGGISSEAVRFLPFGMSMKLLEAASMEEDDTVQDVWARLLFNATNSESDIDINKVHIDLIKSLSASEIIILDLLWECETKALFRSSEEVGRFNIEMNDLAEKRWRKIDINLRNVTTQNLIRLRCLTIRPRPIDMNNILKQAPIESPRGTPFFTVEPRNFEKMVKDIMDNLMIYSGTSNADINREIALQRVFSISSRSGSIKVPEMNFLLTPLGKELMKACAKPTDKKSHP